MSQKYRKKRHKPVSRCLVVSKGFQQEAEKTQICGIIRGSFGDNLGQRKTTGDFEQFLQPIDF